MYDILTEQFFLFHLCFYFVTCILYKDNYLGRILEQHGNKKLEKGKNPWFVLGLSQCKFCTDFWMALICSCLVSGYYYDYKYLIWGILTPSIIAHFREAE